MDLSMIISQMGAGMLRSISIFLWTLVLSLPLGLIISFGRMSKYKILKGIVTFYISVMRGTPLMLQLLVVYFGPYYIFNANIGQFRYLAIIVGFVLNYAAYFAEIFRAGIQSMPKGQYEAADVLGYSKRQTFMKIILPQVVKNVLPPLTNETITLVKDTSLAYALAYTEMFSLAKQIAAAQTTFTPLIVAAVFYYIFNYVVAWLMGLLEKKFSYYR